MASTLKCNTINTLDGTGNISFSRPIVADISNVTGTLPAIDGSNLTGISGGVIKQVLSTTKTDVYTSSATTWTDITGLSVTITNATTGNKLLITCHIGAAGNTTTSSGYQFRLTVDGTAVGIGDADGSNRPRLSIQDHAGSVSDFASASSCQFLYTTTGTSAHVVKLQGQVGGGTLVFNRTVGDNSDSQYYGRSASTLTVMEVEA